DPQNIFWIGTYKNGVDYFRKSSKHFRLLQHDPQDKTRLSKSDVNFLAEDHLHHIWVGTNGAGIDVLNQKGKVIKRLTIESRNGLSNDVVVAIYEDHQGMIWIGTYYGGLNQYNPQTGDIKVFRHSATDPKSIPDDRVWSITEDRHNQLWIATLTGGLSRYQPEAGKFITYNTSNSNICSNQIRILYKDHQDNLWACSPNGLSRYNENTNDFTVFKEGKTTDGMRPFGEVNDLFQDSRGWYWVSSNAGLIRFNPQNQQAIFLSKKDGLQSNNIKQILEDDQGNLWISSNRGISKLWFSLSDNPNELKPNFLHFDETDGLQGQEFSELAALKTSKGDLLFAGNNGINWFNPHEIQIDTVKPNLQFTGLRIFNKEVNPGETVDRRLLLQKPVYQTNVLELKYAENFFSIEFSALTYLFPEKSKYRYKLEGFDDHWYETDGTANFATFTNLNNGDYTFLVEGSNADGVWNKKPIELKIKVLPPFWKSWYAMVLYALSLIGILTLLRYLVLMKERMNVRVEEERREAQRIHELDSLKLKFFTNISHEFRTPLTLILSPVEKLLAKVGDTTDQRQLSLIHQNARRLLNMINQILDFRKMEMQGLSYQPSHGDLIQFMQDVVASFRELSENKNIDLRLVTELPELTVEFDRDKLEKIMFNLLSNAFKFTPNNGLVIIQIELQDETPTNQRLIIRVKDNGIGIAPEQAEKIFDRFYQSESSQQVAEKGTGIGLSLVREYVQLHGGTVLLESAPGVGSSFTITLPVVLDEQHQKVEQKTATPQLEEKPVFSVENNFEAVSVNGGKATVLITEDNDDLRTYLKEQLAEKYQILEATNGKEGLASLRENMPDLIISDLMMPEMDGIELCKQAKSDPITCHIPFIMLTAKTSEQQQLEGLQIGADDYLTKPFNLQILEAKVNNLIQLKMNIRRSFRTKLQIQPKDISINSLDEQFIEKILNTMEDNMGNSEFTVEEFSRIMGVSRMQLYKKMVSLTGKPPVEFIRIMRLKRAAQLLQKSQLNVSEVAYQVGFNDPKYFSKQFKAEFKVLPSKYLGSNLN
ncbi:MAG TPA: ATP-binding protein, partial [Sunxiuqinia sp.]|nr:ATP-binding protein [Sunxiuqinia sp.]